MGTTVFDDMGRRVFCPKTPSRIVSLVPSDTYSLSRLGCGEKLVGRTDFCELPVEALKLPSVGGTKNVRVKDVLDLKPDLVIANQEENTRPVLEKIAQAKVPVYISFPRRVEDGFAHLAKMMRLLESTRELVVKLFFKEAYGLKNDTTLGHGRRVFVPIWNEPLMTFSQDTYAHSLLETLGFVNVFAGDELGDGREDLGKRSPLGADQNARQKKRYPRLTMEDLLAKDIDMILLPNEPFKFGSEHVERFKSLWPTSKKAPEVLLVDGKDLFWHGVHTIDAIGNLKKTLS